VQSRASSYDSCANARRDARSHSRSRAAAMRNHRKQPGRGPSASVDFRFRIAAGRRFVWPTRAVRGSVSRATRAARDRANRSRAECADPNAACRLWTLGARIHDVLRRTASRSQSVHRPMRTKARAHPFPRLLRHRQPRRAQPVAEEVEALRRAPDERPVRVLVEPQRGEGLVHELHGPPQLPAPGRQHQQG